MYINNEFNGNNYSSEYMKLNQSNLECESSYVQADDLVKAGQVQAGFDLLVKIIQYSPKFGKAWNYLGWIHENYYQNFMHAQKCYTQAIESTPDYAAAYINYAGLLVSTGRFEQLTAHLDKALTVPNIFKDKIYSYYGLASEMQQNLEAAMNYYLEAAMIAIDTNTIAYCKEGINRCKMKLELKKNTVYELKDY